MVQVGPRCLLSAQQSDDNGIFCFLAATIFSTMMHSTSTSSSSAPPKPCNICKEESCIVIPSIASSLHLCLLHYYTTGAHQRHPRSATIPIAESSRKRNFSLFVENQKIQHQLPKVQELFSEAFIDLEKEIREESARRFQSEAEDPLAALLDSTAPSSLGYPSAPSARTSMFRSKLSTSSRGTSSRGAPSNSLSFRKRTISNQTINNNSIHSGRSGQKEDDGIEGEWGFIREAILPEKIRRLQQAPVINLDLDNYNTPGGSSGRTAMSTKRKAQGSASKSFSRAASTPATTAFSKPNNPYQHRNAPRTSIWNQVLDSQKDDDKNGDKQHNNKNQKKPKTSWEELEKRMVRNITSSNQSYSSLACSSCGSSNIEMHGNITSRNNDVRKGEVWGMKDRSETVVERCRCVDCGKVWNEE